MSDSIDRAQEREQFDRELALKEQGRRIGAGTAECEECGAAISALRQKLGARLCVADQIAVEAEQRKKGKRTCV